VPLFDAYSLAVRNDLTLLDQEEFSADELRAQAARCQLSVSSRPNTCIASLNRRTGAALRRGFSSLVRPA